MALMLLPLNLGVGDDPTVSQMTECVGGDEGLDEGVLASPSFRKSQA